MLRGAAIGAAGGVVGAAGGRVVSSVVNRATPATKGVIGEAASEARSLGLGYVSTGNSVVQTGGRTATGRAAAAHYDHGMGARSKFALPGIDVVGLGGENTALLH